MKKRLKHIRDFGIDYASTRVILGKDTDLQVGTHVAEQKIAYVELGGMFDVTHGAGLAAVCPSRARYVYKDCLPRFVRYAKNVIGVTIEGTDEEIALADSMMVFNKYQVPGRSPKFC